MKHENRSGAMKRNSIILTLWLLPLIAGTRAADWAVYEGKSGPGMGRHVVFLAGDEEYRSEEGLPMLAKILSQWHGFKCTVLFPIDKDGAINPNQRDRLPGAEALDSADAIVMLLRFRAWPDEAMKHFVDAYLAGKPIIALRTSTHAFSFGNSGAYKQFSWDSAEWKGGFGKQVLGETWVNHWGAHKHEATRGIIEPLANDNPLLRGVKDIFADTDVYEAYPPPDAKVLVRGQVLQGMNPTDPPVEGKKNNPMMPVVWTRQLKNQAGHENKLLCTTMGAATDLQNEGLRRLIVNAVYWGVGLDVPAQADVAFVDAYKPTMYGFNGHRRGLTPADHALGKVLPAGTGPAP
jgi:type 1 glutamine amidotransferase